MSELSNGVRGTREVTVTNQNTASALGSGGLDDAYVRRLTDFVDARLYLADHRVLLLLKCMLCSELPDAVFTRARKSVLNYRFS